MKVEDKGPNYRLRLTVTDHAGSFRAYALKGRAVLQMGMNTVSFTPEEWEGLADSVAALIEADVEREALIKETLDD